MQYKVPLYKLKKKHIQKLGEIIVEKTSLGIYEIISRKKIRMTAGLVTIYELIPDNCIFIISSDLNGSHLVVPEESAKGIHKKRLYNYDKYVKEHKKVKNKKSTIATIGI